MKNLFILFCGVVATSGFAADPSHFAQVKSIYENAKNITTSPELEPSFNIKRRGTCVVAYRPDDILGSYLHLNIRKDPLLGWTERAYWEYRQPGTNVDNTFTIAMSYSGGEYTGTSATNDQVNIRRVYWAASNPNDEFWMLKFHTANPDLETYCYYY